MEEAERGSERKKGYVEGVREEKGGGGGGGGDPPPPQQNPNSGG